MPTDVDVSALGDVAEDAGVQLEVNGEAQGLTFEDGVAVASVTAGGGEPTFRLLEGGTPVDFSTSPDGSDPATEATAGTVPGWTSLLPPFVAIAIALAFRQVIPALLVGVWIGAWWTYGFSIRGMWDGLLDVPDVWVLDALAPPDGDSLPILYAAVSTILPGAVWGDHCSPISDTTVLSSLASQYDHIDHVRTQAPYALVAGGVSLVLGLVPVGFGTPWWIALPVSAVALVAVLVWMGRPVPEPSPEPAASAATA